MKHDINKIILVGENLFKEQGYYNTGTEEILETSAYPRSSFYHHFKNKEGFAKKVLENYGSNAALFYHEILSDSSINPLKRIENFFIIMMESTEEKAFKSQCLIQKIAGECAGTNEVLRDAAASELERLIEEFRLCLEKGQELGEIRSDISAYDLASFLQSQLYGSHTLSRLTKSQKPMHIGLKIIISHISK